MKTVASKRFDGPAENAGTASRAADKAVESPASKPRKRKLAEVVAERIQADIAAIGWPVGKVLGKEPELLKKYGVSRATLREAIRQLERQGVATMRRGFSGGLVMQEPARMAVVQVLAAYLELTDVGLDELFEARSILEIQAVGLAIKRLSDADVVALRRDIRLLDETQAENLQQEVRLHLSIRRTIATATRNPALALFLESLNRVTGAFMPDYARLAKMRQGRLRMRATKRQLVEAIVSGNVFAAELAVQTELADSYQAAARNLKRFRRETGRKDGLATGAAPQFANWEANHKLSHRLAAVIARAVAQDRSPPGTRIGSEPEFIARFGVSRAVFREAARLLEGYGIIRMQRGFSGGIVVGSPDPSHAVSLVTGYLSYAKLSLPHFFEVLRTLELAVAPMAAVRAPLEKIGEIQAAVAELAGSKDRRKILAGIEANSVMLQKYAGNRAIELIGLVIHAYAPRDGLDLPPMKFCRALISYQQEILAAVAKRDEGLARRKVGQLLTAVDVWWGSKYRKNWLKRL